MVGKTNLVSITLATIIVTYQPGRACTCSNGTRTYMSKDTSGSFTFKVAKKGTWTISDGVETKTVNVTQSVETIVINLQRAYIMGEGTSVSGAGWDARRDSVSGNTFTITLGMAGHTWQTGYGAYLYDTRQINLTPYKELVIVVHSIGQDDACDKHGDFGLAINSSIDHKQSNMKLYINSGGKTFKLDVSGYSGSYYIGFVGFNNAIRFTYPTITATMYLV